MYLKPLRISVLMKLCNLISTLNTFVSYSDGKPRATKMGNQWLMGRRALPKTAIPSKVYILPRQKDPSSEREGVAENSPLRIPGENHDETFAMFMLSTNLCHHHQRILRMISATLKSTLSMNRS